MRRLRLGVLAALVWAAACGPAAALSAPPSPLPAITAAAVTPTLAAGTALPIATALLPEPTRQPTLQPLPSATALPALPTATDIPRITLLFTGDINPGRCVYTRSKAANDMALPYRAVADLLQQADIAIGSLDGTLSDYNPPNPCVETTRNLMAPSEAVQGMQFAGFDVITVATNHMKDCGLIRGCVDNAMFDTLSTLRAAGIQPTGAGADLAEATTPAIVTVQGVRFAFLGFSAINNAIWATDDGPGTAPFKKDVYLDAIRRARAEADVVIVLPHWGREYSASINYEQWQAAADMVEAGATLVIGNHPHHVQGVETFPNGAVAAYALGNFVFDQTWSDGTLYTIQGLMLQATFTGPHLEGIQLLPIHIYDDLQPRLAPPDEAASILQAVLDSMAEAPKR